MEKNFCKESSIKDEEMAKKRISCKLSVFYKVIVNFKYSMNSFLWFVIFSVMTRLLPLSPTRVQSNLSYNINSFVDILYFAISWSIKWECWKWIAIYNTVCRILQHVSNYQWNWYPFCDNDIDEGWTQVCYLDRSPSEGESNIIFAR